MWFKNLILYRFTKPFDLTPEELEQKLASKPFRPVGKVEPSFTGWFEPLGREGQQLVHVSGNCLMICTRTEEKILPAAAVRELLEVRVEEIEEKQGRKLRRKEKQDLKDEVLLDMMPRAFSKSSRNYAYIDLQNGWLVVDSASASKAEALISLLRECVGSLPVVPIQVQDDPSTVMTGWLQQGRYPQEFQVGEACELREPGDDGGIVRIRKQDLASEEIQVHLQAGKKATQLALCFDERLCFVVDTALQLKRIRFEDSVLAEADNQGGETAAQRFDTDFTLMTLEFSRLLPRLLAVFGGEVDKSQPKLQAA